MSVSTVTAVIDISQRRLDVRYPRLLPGRGGSGRGLCYADQVGEAAHGAQRLHGDVRFGAAGYVEGRLAGEDHLEAIASG